MILYSPDSPEAGPPELLDAENEKDMVREFGG